MLARTLSTSNSYHEITSDKTPANSLFHKACNQEPSRHQRKHQTTKKQSTPNPSTPILHTNHTHILQTTNFPPTDQREPQRNNAALRRRKPTTLQPNTSPLTLARATSNITQQPTPTRHGHPPSRTNSLPANPSLSSRRNPFPTH